MKRVLFVLALVAASISASDLEAILKKSNDQFSADMFQAVIKNEGHRSCVLSAFSVLPPLAQLALASVGKSHDEILRAIGLPNDNVTKQVFSDLNSRLRSVKGVDLALANKLYVRKDYSVDDQFAAMSKDIFNSEIENIDFQQKSEAAAEINAWVEDHTHNRIKDLVQADSIDENTAAILVNAIYFKGRWRKPFKDYKTANRVFHVTKDLTVELPTMHQTDFFKYTENKELDAKFLEMEYEGGETSLVVALPNKIDVIDSLIEKIKDPATLNKAIADLNFDIVHIYLPKFKIETTTDLRNVLEKMKIKKLFQEKYAKLYKLLKETKDLYVSKAAQKTYIDINEEGAEAAAVNDYQLAMPLALNTFIGGAEFNADRPFLFFIREKNIILFSGVFRS